MNFPDTFHDLNFSNRAGRVPTSALTGLPDIVSPRVGIVSVSTDMCYYQKTLVLVTGSTTVPDVLETQENDVSPLIIGPHPSPWKEIFMKG